MVASNRTIYSTARTTVVDLPELVAALARLTKARSPARPMIFSDKGAMVVVTCGTGNKSGAKKNKKNAHAAELVNRM